jgi:hypothetical protein
VIQTNVLVDNVFGMARGTVLFTVALIYSITLSCYTERRRLRERGKGSEQSTGHLVAEKGGAN